MREESEFDCDWTIGNTNGSKNEGKEDNDEKLPVKVIKSNVTVPV